MCQSPGSLPPSSKTHIRRSRPCLRFSSLHGLLRVRGGQARSSSPALRRRETEQTFFSELNRFAVGRRRGGSSVCRDNCATINSAWPQPRTQQCYRKSCPRSGRTRKFRSLSSRSGRTATYGYTPHGRRFAVTLRLHATPGPSRNPRILREFRSLKHFRGILINTQ